MSWIPQGEAGDLFNSGPSENKAFHQNSTIIKLCTKIPESGIRTEISPNRVRLASRKMFEHRKHYAITCVVDLEGYIITQLSTSVVSDGHSLTLAESGDVFSWGDGDYGKLEPGNSDRQKRPNQIYSLQGTYVIQL